MSRETVNLEKAKLSNVEKWVKMLVDSGAKQVYAPSVAPMLLSKTKIVRSVDIPYADTDNGYATVAMLPQANLAYIQSGQGTIPAAAAFTSVKTPAAYGLDMPAGYGQPKDGYVIAQDGSGKSMGVCPWIDGALIHANYSGYYGLALEAAAGDVEFCASFGFATYYKAFYGLGGAITFGNAKYSNGQEFQNHVITLAAGGCDFIGVTICDSTGAVGTTVESSQTVHLVFATDTALVQTDAGYRNSSIVKSELLEQGKISHIRCTGMQMLVTNLASPLDAGGELVVGRVKASELEAPTTSDLMTSIKSLPEKKVWSSRPLVDGGYVWYLPDDMESYEPRNIDDYRSDNVIVGAFHMASASGQVRVNCTWEWEFYTPAQIFPRGYTHAWDDHYLEMFELLRQREATSANAGHVALIAGISALASGAYQFYKAHADVIDPVLRSGAELVSRKIVRHMDKGKAKDKQPKSNSAKHS